LITAFVPKSHATGFSTAICYFIDKMNHTVIHL